MRQFFFELFSSFSIVPWWFTGVWIVTLAFGGMWVFFLCRAILRLMLKSVAVIRRYPTSLPLILANLVPLAGVFFLDWKLFEILFLYWLEVVVYGLFSVEKLKKVLMHTPPGNMPRIRVTAFVIQNVHSRTAPLRPIIPDFIGIYRFFAIGTLIIIVILSGISVEGWLTEEGVVRFSFKFLGTPLDFLITTLIALASYSLSHGVSYVQNFLGKEEYRKVTVREQLQAPLDRLGYMWASILFGSFIAMPFGSPLVALVLIICIKTALDVHAHIKEHNKLQAPQSSI